MFWLNVQIRNTPLDLINHVEKHSIIITNKWQGYIMCMSDHVLYYAVWSYDCCCCCCSYYYYYYY